MRGLRDSPLRLPYHSSKSPMRLVASWADRSARRVPIDQIGDVELASGAGGRVDGPECRWQCSMSLDQAGRVVTDGHGAGLAEGARAVSGGQPDLR